jgi:ribonuclease Z
MGLSLEQERNWYLFDCGEGTQRQIMLSGLSSGKLGTIFITHLHGDHYYGLPGLLDSRKMDRIDKPLTIYGPRGIASFLACAMDTSKEKLGYELDIKEYEPHDTYRFEHFSLTVLPLHHSIESHAFHIEEYTVSNRLDEAKLRSAGLPPSSLYGDLKQGRSVEYKGRRYDPSDFLLDPIEGRRLIVAGDNATPEILGTTLDGLDLLVHECTYTQEVFDHLPVKILHTTAKTLGRTVQRHGVKHLITTHISPRYRKEGKYTLTMLEEELREEYEGVCWIAEDLLSFRWRSREQLQAEVKGSKSL